MLKSISIAAMALALTTGIASAQSTTERQRGAALFDQGGDFQVDRSQDNLDRRSTASIQRDGGTPSLERQRRSEAGSYRPAQENRSSERGNQIQWGGDNPFFHN